MYVNGYVMQLHEGVGIAECRAYNAYMMRRECSYGVATISSLLKILGLFCKRALLKRRYSAKET